MNIKYVISLATIVLLSIGGSGILADRSHGQVAVAAVASLRPQVDLMPTAQVPSPLPTDNEVDDRDDNDNEQVDDRDDDNDQEDADEANDPDIDNGQEAGQEASGADAEDDNDQDSQQATPVAQPTITAAAAQQAAEAYLKAGRARKVKLDHEDGQPVYDVKIGNTKVEVDARTGVVLSTKTDD